MTTLIPEIFENDSVNYYKDLSYNQENNGILNQYDVYTPINKIKVPIFIWIHGGAWVCEDKKLFHDFAINLVKKGGFACALINYRLSSQLNETSHTNIPIQHPVHVKDCLKGILHIASNPFNLPYDVSNLFIGGHSAGGHLSGLIALDPQSYLEPEDSEKCNYLKEIKGVVSTQGVFDLIEFKNTDPKYETNYVVPAFGSSQEEILKKASPQFTTPNLYINPSYLIIHSKDDNLVSINQALNYYEHLKNYGINASLNTESFGPHDDAPQNPILQDLIIEFIKHNCKEVTFKK